IIYMAPGDELLSDSFPFKEIENGIIWEVEGKLVIFVVPCHYCLIQLKFCICITFSNFPSPDKQLSGSFVGESMQDNGSMVFANYKEGATDPTFLYLAVGLKEVKC
ncbi:hypothetical protein GW17_00002276, partial [Ensete ventricosum]